METWKTLQSAQSAHTLYSEKTLMQHLPMTHMIARNHSRLPVNVEFEELYSAGVIGLMESSSKFDPERKIAFASLAQLRVQGTIQDSMRRLDDCQWLQAELKLSQIGSLNSSSDDESGEELLNQIPCGAEDDPLFECMKCEASRWVTKAVAELPELECLEPTLCFFEKSNRNEIASALEVSEVRIQQIRAPASIIVRLLRAHNSEFAAMEKELHGSLEDCSISTLNLYA